jgi:hypothetical protein
MLQYAVSYWLHNVTMVTIVLFTKVKQIILIYFLMVQINSILGIIIIASLSNKLS